MSYFQKVRFFLLGQDFIGAEIRISHFKKILNTLNIMPETILDAGCGTGDFSFYVAERYQQAALYAYDINTKTLKKNNEIQKNLGFKNIIFQNVDLLQLNEKSKYDLIFSIGTLIYFSREETRTILLNLTGALKDGGFLYLDLPQEDFLEVNYISIKYYKEYYKKLKQENSGSLYTYQEVKDILQEIGYEIVWSNKSFSHPGKLAWESDNLLRERGYIKTRYLLLPLLKFLAHLDSITKHKKGCCFVILARKKTHAREMDF